MNFFKSIWLKIKLPSGRIPAEHILIPMKEHEVSQEVIKEKKPRKPRKKKTQEVKGENL